MENKNISQIVLERIKGEGIKPISKKVFNIKRVLFWLAVAFSLVISALAFSLILSALFNNDWDLYGKFGFSFILKTLPYFWLVSLLVFIILGEFYYRKTSLGYRRNLSIILGFYLLYTIIFGIMFYFVGIGNFIEQSLLDNAPSYSNYILNRHEVWLHPEEGLLSGEIVLLGDNELELIDTNGSVWVINTEEAFTNGDVKLEVGEKIKILGDKVEENIFNAEEIRPWVGIGMNSKRKALNITPVIQ
ncbi:MAG: hypothetical protein WCI91_00495 [Candidatus Nomurabacteria bacterium]